MVKHLPASAGDRRDAGPISGSGRSPGGQSGNPLQCSCLKNPMDSGTWWATVHKIAESDMTENMILDCNIIQSNVYITLPLFFIFLFFFFFLLVGG